MDYHEWNRKDSIPEETIAIIEQILSDLNIRTKFVAEYSYKNYWYSNRLEVDGISFIGSNGKGITEKYAKASAYGEFMERLQAGFLLNNLYPGKLIASSTSSSHPFQSTEWINYVNCAEKGASTDVSDVLLKFIKDSKPCVFWDIQNKLEVAFPSKYIDIICASNGLSAGNTFEEAFCQGLCEVFERYILRCIYYSDYTYGLFRHIADSVLIGLQSYTLIDAMRQKGYSIFVIDCSLNNRLPVLGVFMLDSSKSKYFFKLASDINMDICLQRCITEIFQGCTFDLNFRMNMSMLSFESRENDFWENIDRNREYTKAIIDGTGKLPNRFIRQVMKSTSDISIFANAPLSNRQAAYLLLKIALKLNDKLLVSNMTKYGFPTLRIYIPYFSECFYFESRRLERVYKLFGNIKKAFKHKRIMNKGVFHDILELSVTHPYSYGFSLSKLIGVILTNPDMLEYLYDINLLIALLACYHKEEAIARDYIRKYVKSGRLNAKRALFEEATVAAICANVSCNDFIDYISGFCLNENEVQRIKKYYAIAMNGFDDIYCTDCDHCLLKSKCQYPAVSHIDKSLDSHISGNMSDEFDIFLSNMFNTMMR